MLLDKITMPAHKAYDMRLKYRNIPVKERQPGDEEKMLGYQALARGQSLIELIGTMQRGGLDERGLPRLAIGRATARRVYFVPPDYWRSNTRGYRFIPNSRYERKNSTDHVVLPDATWDSRTVFNRRLSSDDPWAAVPPIPPEHRPRYGDRAANLNLYHILWEAEWSPEPPGDPVLLRHIAGTLYAVIAQWDLTALEKAVMQSQMFVATN